MSSYPTKVVKKVISAQKRVMMGQTVKGMDTPDPKKLSSPQEKQSTSSSPVSEKKPSSESHAPAIRKSPLQKQAKTTPTPKAEVEGKKTTISSSPSRKSTMAESADKPIKEKIKKNAAASGLVKKEQDVKDTTSIAPLRDSQTLGEFDELISSSQNASAENEETFKSESKRIDEKLFDELIDEDDQELLKYVEQKKSKLVKQEGEKTTDLKSEDVKTEKDIKAADTEKTISAARTEDAMEIEEVPTKQQGSQKAPNSDADDELEQYIVSSQEKTTEKKATTPSDETIPISQQPLTQTMTSEILNTFGGEDEESQDEEMAEKETEKEPEKKEKAKTRSNTKKKAAKKSAQVKKHVGETVNKGSKKSKIQKPKKMVSAPRIAKPSSKKSKKSDLAKKEATKDRKRGPNTKPRRSKPGVVALRQIRAYQKSTGLLLQKICFIRAVREVALRTVSLRAGDDDSIVKKAEGIRFTPAALEAIQEACEANLIDLFGRCNSAASHARRVTVMPKDLQIIKSVCELPEFGL